MALKRQKYTLHIANQSNMIVFDKTGTLVFQPEQLNIHGYMCVNDILQTATDTTEQTIYVPEELSIQSIPTRCVIKHQDTHFNVAFTSDADYIYATFNVLHVPTKCNEDIYTELPIQQLIELIPSNNILVAILYVVDNLIVHTNNENFRGIYYKMDYRFIVYSEYVHTGNRTHKSVLVQLDRSKLLPWSCTTIFQVFVVLTNMQTTLHATQDVTIMPAYTHVITSMIYEVLQPHQMLQYMLQCMPLKISSLLTDIQTVDTYVARNNCSVDLSRVTNDVTIMFPEGLLQHILTCIYNCCNICCLTSEIKFNYITPALLRMTVQLKNSLLQNIAYMLYTQRIEYTYQNDVLQFIVQVQSK